MSVPFKEVYAKFWKVSSYHNQGTRRMEIEISTIDKVRVENNKEKDEFSKPKIEEKVEYTRWFPVVFGGAIDFFQGLKEGTPIAITGKFIRKKRKDSNIYDISMRIFGVKNWEKKTRSENPEYLIEEKDEEKLEDIPF